MTDVVIHDGVNIVVVVVVVVINVAAIGTGIVAAATYAI